MIIALFTLLFLGGGSGLLANFDAIMDNAKTEIADEDRRELALDIFKAVQSEREDFGKQLQGHGKALGELYEDPNASDAQADAIWDDFFRDIETHHDQLLDRREQLKAYVTPKEWSAIFAPDAQE